MTPILRTSRQVTRVASAAYHTSRINMAEEASKRGGFLSRLNPFAKREPEPSTLETVVAAPAQDLNVEIQPEEEEVQVPSWKGEVRKMHRRQIEKMVRDAAKAHQLDFADHNRLSFVPLDDPQIKFKVLKQCMVESGKEIANKDIDKIQTLRDVVDYLSKSTDSSSSSSPSSAAEAKGHLVAAWFENEQSKLPPNMVFIPYQKSRGIKAEDRRTTNKRFL